MDPTLFPNIFRKLLFPLSVILVAYLINLLARKSIQVFLENFKKKLGPGRKTGKTDTISSLLKSTISTVIFIIAFLTILSYFGINTMPLLTSAGIVGLAFSFGSQSLIKDILAGFFIIFEDQFNIGDTVRIGKLEGIVHKVGLRVTVLKDKEGNFIYIPNSQITTVTRVMS